MAAGLLAAVKIGVQQTEIREFAMPDVPADAGLLRVEAVGVCGTDVHTYCEPLSNGPFIMGHENVGRIASMGPIAAQRWGLRTGDLVLVEGYRVCGHCDSCLSGYFGYCPREGGEESPEGLRPDSLVRFQPSRGGGFSQYLYLHPGSRFHKIPDHVPVEQATLALPFGNGWQWTYLDGGVGPGKTVLIQGPGQQGLGCVVASREAGAGCIIVSGLASDAKRLEVARRLGADFTINVDSENLVDRVKELTGGRGIDLALDVATGSAATVLPAIQALAARGTLVIVPRSGKMADFPMDVVHEKSLTLKCVRGHSYQAVEMAIRVIASGKYPLEEVTSHKFGLGQVDKAIRAVEGEGPTGVIHVTIDPWSLPERP